MGVNGPKLVLKLCWLVAFSNIKNTTDTAIRRMLQSIRTRIRMMMTTIWEAEKEPISDVTLSSTGSQFIHQSWRQKNQIDGKRHDQSNVTKKWCEGANYQIFIGDASGIATEKNWYFIESSRSGVLCKPKVHGLRFEILEQSNSLFI